MDYEIIGFPSEENYDRNEMKENVSNEIPEHAEPLVDKFSNEPVYPLEKTESTETTKEEVKAEETKPTQNCDEELRKFYEKYIALHDFFVGKFTIFNKDLEDLSNSFPKKKQTDSIAPEKEPVEVKKPDRNIGDVTLEVISKVIKSLTKKSEDEADEESSKLRHQESDEKPDEAILEKEESISNTIGDTNKKIKRKKKWELSAFLAFGAALAVPFILGNKRFNLFNNNDVDSAKTEVGNIFEKGFDIGQHDDYKPIKVGVLNIDEEEKSTEKPKEPEKPSDTPKPEEQKEPEKKEPEKPSVAPKPEEQKPEIKEPEKPKKVTSKESKGNPVDVNEKFDFSKTDYGNILRRKKVTSPVLKALDVNPNPWEKLSQEESKAFRPPEKNVQPQIDVSKKRPNLIETDIQNIKTGRNNNVKDIQRLSKEVTPKEENVSDVTSKDYQNVKETSPLVKKMEDKSKEVTTKTQTDVSVTLQLLSLIFDLYDQSQNIAIDARQINLINYNSTEK